MSTINCLGKLIDLSRPQVMGILNVTPDSFYDGGSTIRESAIFDKVQKMIDHGVDIIDLGGYSTRPKADFVSESDELDRVIPAVKFISKHFPDAIISVDTFRSEVAARSIDAGAAMINDISGGSLDADMMRIVAKYQVPYIMMHMLGDIETTHNNYKYDDIIKQMLSYFADKIYSARALGITDLILDPGFGFSKSLEENFKVLNHLRDFQITGIPILVGVSRKSMICRTLGVKPDEALNGTTAINVMALMKGVKFLRVHDVREARECIDLYQKMVAEN